MSFALFMLYHVVLSLCGGWVVVVSQRLLSLNPTAVIVVLLLGLELGLLLSCDKNDPKIRLKSNIRIERNKENESCSTI